VIWLLPRNREMRLLSLWNKLDGMVVSELESRDRSVSLDKVLNMSELSVVILLELR